MIYLLLKQLAKYFFFFFFNLFIDQITTKSGRASWIESQARIDFVVF